ncbi:MAG: aminodeoxychorismate synthase component I, partial [Deltaproteobacteria bacterium]|nr:aminodeoxychorismate synthase component I [Deltaproteobacteria bacterium]
VERLICTGKDNPFDFLNQVQKKLEQGWYLAGWFAYEFGYLLEPVFSAQSQLISDRIVADLGVFPKPAEYDHNLKTSLHGTWFSDTDDEKPHQHSSRYSTVNVRPDKKEADYLSSIKTIKEYIAAGDTYQVNFTLKLLFDFHGSPIEFYKTLRDNQSVCYGAYIQSEGEQIMSFSPELFFRKSGMTCTVRPMKGTLKRGRTLAEDIEYAKFLSSDSKNRSENVMIVDLLRNDLGRLAQMGSVHVSSLFDVETYETLHQMTSTITGQLKDDITLPTLFKALFPCGSVTGAPKIRTMEIIQELESSPRGVYTGAIGYLSPDGDAVFNVPIRTVVIQNNKGEMGIGSGIIHDSDPHNEWEECLLKANFLTKPQEEIHLIETMLWKPDTGYWLLAEHLDRLKNSAVYFQFLFDVEDIKSSLIKVSKDFPNDTSQRVRLLLDKTGKFTITHADCPSQSSTEKTSTRLPRIIISDKRIHSSNRFLYHKTTNRTLYDKERATAVENGYYEVIFLNENDEVSEGAITSLFIKKGDYFYTPPVYCGLLPGVFRDYFIKNSKDYPVREKPLTVEDLQTADAVYVGNSVRGLVEVELFFSHRLDNI